MTQKLHVLGFFFLNVCYLKYGWDINVLQFWNDPFTLKCRKESFLCKYHCFYFILFFCSGLRSHTRRGDPEWTGRRLHSAANWGSSKPRRVSKKQNHLSAVGNHQSLHTQNIFSPQDQNWNNFFCAQAGPKLCCVLHFCWTWVRLFHVLTVDLWTTI